MSNSIYDLFDESIKHEKLLAKIYLVFCDLFPEDREFWWNLSQEESGHASLLHTARLFYESEVPDAETILFDDISTLEQFNIDLLSKLEDWDQVNPNKIVAYQFALDMEEKGQEDYLQKFLQAGDCDYSEIFQKLSNANDMHADKIKQLIDVYAKKTA